MMNEYSNIELRTFAQSVLKILCLVFMGFFIIAAGLYVSKSRKIADNNEALYTGNELYVAYKDLGFNVLVPSIYVDFESTNSKLAKLNLLASKLSEILEKTKIISQANKYKFDHKLEKLNNDIVLYNGLIARSGSEYNSFNILYVGLDAVQIRQNVLSFVYSNDFDKSQADDYMQYLIREKDELHARIKSAQNELSGLKNIAASDNELLGELVSLDKITQLEQQIARTDKYERFLAKSVSLLRTISELNEYKKSIIQSGLNREIVYFIKTFKDANADLISKQQRLLVSAGILFFLGLAFAALNFYYGIALSRHLRLFYRTFMNSPVQQSLVHIDSQKNYLSEVPNSAFRFGSSGLKNKSNELSKKAASSFYGELVKILATLDVRGFEVGTLVHELHTKLSPFDEDEAASRKDSRFFSIYRKLISPEYELISKVDVTKKIWQIKEYKERLDSMRRKLERDSLTDLLSWQALQDNEINNPKSSSNKIFLYLHIDHFNDIRLNYSTVLIDEIIKAFAKSLALALDTDDNHAQLAATPIYRLQMDEFVIVYSDLSRAQVAAQKISEHFSNQKHKHIESTTRNKFNLRFAQNEQLSDLELNIGISSERDIARKHANKDESINRLAQAIIASYESARIKAPYVVYEEGTLGVEIQYAQQQLATLQIRNALANDDIFVVAQGVHNSQSHEVEYYELLVRMRDENGKTVPPGLFLDIARRVGLYKDIQWVVISKAFALLERYPGKKFSINLANSDIMSADTRKFFIDKLKSSAYASNLCIEILESEGIEQYDEVVDFLSEVKTYGCKVAIDDFGSGYSNYYRLLKVEFDYLKVDGSIIAALPHDKNAIVVLKTIVDFAHAQGYEVVAEFVSSAEILRLINSFGIEKAQGYELSRPETPENLFESAQ